MSRKTVLRVVAIPAILVVGFLGMQGLGSTKKETNKREFEPEARAVETQTLVFGELALQIEGDGVIESERKLEIVSEATGRVTFAKNNLKDGTSYPPTMVTTADRDDREDRYDGDVDPGACLDDVSKQRVLNLLFASGRFHATLPPSSTPPAGRCRARRVAAPLAGFERGWPRASRDRRGHRT